MLLLALRFLFVIKSVSNRIFSVILKFKKSRRRSFKLQKEMSLKLTVKQIQELPEDNESYPSDLFCMVQFGESMQKFDSDLNTNKRIVKIDSDAEFNIEKEGALKIGSDGVPQPNF